MDRIEFQPTPKTPYILLDPAGKINFRGRSIPEDVSSFYDKIIDWVREYAEQPAASTVIAVEMEYLNSGTSKYMLKMLKIAKQIESNGFDLRVDWSYEEGDDDIMERGEYYATILDLKINFIEQE